MCTLHDGLENNAITYGNTRACPCVTRACVVRNSRLDSRLSTQWEHTCIVKETPSKIFGTSFVINIWEENNKGNCDDTLTPEQTKWSFDVSVGSHQTLTMPMPNIP